MRSAFLALGLCLLLAPLGAAADCPATEQTARDARTDPLFRQLAASTSEDTGMRLASEIWQIWSTAPDTEAQKLLDLGVERIGWGEFGEAEKVLSRLITYCPDYPEGWNQRAFARFLARDYDGALADLDQTLALEPRHFGALAGRGLTLLSQGRQLPGYAEIRKAAALHPWLNERHLLPPEERL